MAVPKQRHTKSRRNKRRMNIFIKKNFDFKKCPKCGRPVLFHRACLSCGYYKGREAVDVLKRLDKKEKKQREKEIKAKEKEGKATEKKPLSWEGLSKK